jgi:HEAT repeat protein
MPFPLDDFTRAMVERHFRRKNLEWTEDYFLRSLDSHSRHDVYWAVLALRECGTVRCVAALRAKLSHPMQDVKCTSILTIAHIAGAEATPLFGEALLSPTYKEKGYAMWAIRDAADERAVEPVLAYFRKNRAKLRRGALANGTLPDGVEFLNRHVNTQPAIRDFFAEVRSVWERLAPGEREEILKRVPQFLG